MNFIIYFLLLFSFTSCNQEVGKNYELTEQHQKYLKEIKRTGYVLNKHNLISFSISKINSKTGEWLKHLVFFSRKSNWIEQIISSTDLSDGFYGDTLLFYKDKSSDRQVFIWKQEGEYYSYLNIYLFEEGNIEFIGDLCVGLDCKNCDVFNFPENKIKVSEVTNGLKILFTEQTIFKGSISQKMPNLKVGIKTNKLTLLYDGVNSKISY